LGARIAISNHQKNTETNFLEVLNKLKNNKDIHGNLSPLINDELLSFAKKYEKDINNMLDYERDYLIDFFGFKTLEKSYLLKIDKKSIERPQHLFMRVALAIHGDDLTNVKKTYDNLSLKNYTHATPTLFNAGCPNQQLSSCYLIATEDSIEGIFGTITDCAKISKWSGGIGVHVSNIRANGSYIRKTAGYSDGIMPMLKVYNDVARYINQGGGKRNGSFAIYIEPWHSDIFTFLDAKKNHGSEELRARDLFYALWVPDLFMKAIEENSDWYLMCPDKCPGLPDIYGEDFDKLYFKYVEEKRYNKKIKARELWDAIISSQIETGVPYMLYKDAANEKSNQKNIDTIKSSNLCAEILEVSNSEETAVCNLSSICLPSILEYPIKSYREWFDLLSNEEKKLSEYYFNGNLKLFSESDCSYCKLLKALLKEVGLGYEEITEERAEDLRLFCNPVPDKFTTVPQLFSVIDNKVKHLGGYTNSWNLFSPRINHNKLRDLSYDLVINLNKIIDKNYYPTEKTKVSNLRHRPIGIGVQGLADLFLCLKLPFDSPEARKINKEIFETMYYGALDSSHDLALKEGPYSTFPGSPMSEGVFQFNMWGLNDEDLSGRWKWKVLRKNIMRNGIRNSLLIALMPTASTSQIMGSYVECFEPLTSNLYTRRTLAGEFVIINPYLIKDLISLDLWNDDTKDRLQYDKGSVKNIRNFPFKDIYRTVWEIPQKSLLEMSADRGAFVCQSQSLNLFFEKPEYKKLSMAHLAGWKLGLKTGSYYIRTKPATNAQRFAMDPEVEKRLKEEDLQNKEDTECLSCGA
jgi:ribonucleoside-diphosphate reductase alpha subunit